MLLSLQATGRANYLQDFLSAGGKDETENADSIRHTLTLGTAPKHPNCAPALLPDVQCQHIHREKLSCCAKHLTPFLPLPIWSLVPMAHILHPVDPGDLHLSAEFVANLVFVASHYFCSSLAAVANNISITFPSCHTSYTL